MEKRAYFPGMRFNNWPVPSKIAPFFADSKTRTTLWSGGNDNWGLSVHGLNGTEHLPPYSQVGGRGPRCQIEAHMTFWANPEHGILLYYKKFGNGLSIHHFSRGDTSRLKEWVRTTHDDLRPVGLYIPFVKAWTAIKEFMNTNGDLPEAITWIKPEELPIGTFPDPWEHPEVE